MTSLDKRVTSPHRLVSGLQAKDHGIGRETMHPQALALVCACVHARFPRLGPRTGAIFGTKGGVRFGQPARPLRDSVGSQRPDLLFRKAARVLRRISVRRLAAEAQGLLRKAARQYLPSLARSDHLPAEGP